MKFQHKKVNLIQRSYFIPIDIINKALLKIQ